MRRPNIGDARVAARRSTGRDVASLPSCTLVREAFGQDMREVMDMESNLLPNSQPFAHRGRRSAVCVLLAAGAFSSACATSVNGPTQRVAVVSDPPGAQVYVNGAPVDVTPAFVDVPRRDPDLELRLEKDGYEPTVLALERWPKFNSRSTKQRGISNLQRQKRSSGTTNLRKPGNGSVRWLSCGRLPVAGRRLARRRWPAVRVRPAWRCARAGCARRGAGRWR